MYKRIIAVSLAAALVLVASGCGKSAEDPKAPASKPTVSTPGTNAPASSGTSSSTTPANTPAQKQKPVYEKVTLGPLKKGDEAKVGPLTVKLEEVAVVTKAAGLPPNYGYIIMRVTVKNDSDGDYTVNATDHYKFDTPEGKRMQLSVPATGQRSPRLQGTLSPGQSQTGWLGYMAKLQGGNFKYAFTHPDYGDATWEFAVQ